MDETKASSTEGLRPMEEILADMNPKKTGKVYQKQRVDFKSYCKQEPPSEQDLLGYFDLLHRERNYKSSTLWTVYSLINNSYKIHYGEKLQNFPRLTILLKSYQSNYKRKVAQTMTLTNVQDLLKKPLPGFFWLVRKAIVALAWSGGLRCDEIHRMKFGNVNRTDQGYVVTFERSKQTGEKEQSNFLVPKSEGGELCFAHFLGQYIEEASKSSPFTANDPLFRGVHGGQRIVKQPMGIHLIRNVAKDVATELGLDNPSSFTGHCWRRSSATQAAGAGATSTDLKRTYGWKQDTTAMRYLDSTMDQSVKVAKMLTENNTNSARSKVNVEENKQVQANTKGKENEAKNVFYITVQSNGTLNING